MGNGSGSMIFSSRGFTSHAAASLADLSDGIGSDSESRYVSVQVHRPFCNINLGGQDLIIPKVCVYILASGHLDPVAIHLFFFRIHRVDVDRTIVKLKACIT